MDLTQIITIASIPIVASVVTVIVEHCLTKERLKSERQNILEREILFTLQKQAEKIFFQLNKIRWNLDQLNEWLKNGNHIDFANAIKNDQKETLEQLSSSQIYFSEKVFKKYDEAVKIFKEYVLVSERILMNENATDAERGELKKLASSFNDIVKDCKTFVFSEIEEQKKSTKK
ncbi:MAG: hypothetical protein WCW64_11435 [Phycisphaerae bacterium]|jgi:uncharacterized lipoprotein YehR (DUF1307 family)